MAAILFLPFGRCSQLPYSVAIKTCSLHQPPTNPALPGFILIGIKIVNSFRNYLYSKKRHSGRISSKAPLLYGSHHTPVFAGCQEKILKISEPAPGLPFTPHLGPCHRRPMAAPLCPPAGLDVVFCKGRLKTPVLTPRFLRR